jgi:hypothetical protein
MKFELHCNGQIFRSESLEHLRKVATQLPEQCVIYQFFKSKMNGLPLGSHDMPFVKRKRVCIPHVEAKLMPYKEVEYAWEMVARGKTRKQAADHFKVSQVRLRLSIRRYMRSDSEKEYENYKYEDIVQLSKQRATV